MRLPNTPRFRGYPVRSRPKERQVTIAAGFACDDGVLLCADTLLSANYRQQGPKVFSWRDDDVAVVVSGAGSYVLLKLAKEAIFKKLVTLRHHKQSFSIKHDVIEPVLASLHDDHIDKAPDREWANGYGLSLLVGAWHQGSHAVLYESHRRACAVVDGFSCVGSGAPVGNYIASTLFSKTLPVMWGRVVAGYLVQQSKAYGEDCGGDTNITVLQNNGKLVNLEPEKIRISEAAANRIHEALGGVLFEATSEDVKGVPESLHAFAHAVTLSRASVRFNQFVVESDVLDRIEAVKPTRAKPTRKSPKRGR